ncbi:MAG: OB-fold nucleic acid binding domain-containing protein [Pseudomonadota bacterium]
MVTAVLTATTFRIDDGTVVRLQSLLAPDATDAPGANGNWPMAQAATAAVRARLLNRRVLIRYRRGRPDRYGRRLAHAWVIGGTRAPTWLQADLLKSGLARFAPDRERATCASRMQRAEAAARRRARGLWALSTYAARPALKPFDLVKRASTFQIVEGRVAKASDVRGRVYLNFGRSWRRDFTVSISRRQMRFFARGRIKPLLLAGQRIRVRGWIVVRNGPMIEIDHTHQIEVLRDRRSPGSQAPHSQAPRSQSPRSKSVARRSEKSPSGREPGKRIRRSPDDHHAPGDPPKKSPVRRSEPGLIDL